MNPRELRPVFREALCAFHLFRSLGVPPEDIFLQTDSDVPPGVKIAMVVKRFGQRFTLGLLSDTPVEMTREEAESEWVQIALALPTMAQADLNAIWLGSGVRASVLEIAISWREWNLARGGLS